MIDADDTLVIGSDIVIQLLLMLWCCGAIIKTRHHPEYNNRIMGRKQSFVEFYMFFLLFLA